VFYTEHICGVFLAERTTGGRSDGRNVDI